MPQPSSRRSLLQAVVLVAAFGLHGVAVESAALAAATVKGTVSLPAELKTGRRFLGHWRVENTNVAAQPASLRGGTVVLLVGPQTQAVPPKNVSVDISGLQANPATVVVSEGSVVEFKNADKVSHDLSTPDQPQVMPPERLSPGTVRKQRFATTGEFLVRCTEYPHIVVSVIVTSSPLFAIVEDKGGFRISDVPEGHATLKVWSNGRWVHEQEVDVPSRGLDLSVKVPKSSAAKESAE
jgi:plastocyanin